MNADRSKKNSRKTATKILALLMLGFASIGATGCEHPLSTMFNQQGETARAAMDAQTQLMQQILEDQREREQDLLSRIDDEDEDENEFTDDEDECLEETGEPCPDEDDVEDDEETELALGDDEAGEPDAGGIGLEGDMVD